MSSSPVASGRRIGGLDAEERRAQRREKLLVAAKGLFTDKGYAGTTIEQLCQAAFVSTKSFYEVFGSREDCYVALYAEQGGQLRDHMASLVASVPEGEDAATEALLTAFVDALLADRARAHLLLGRARLVAPAVEALRLENRAWTAAFIEDLWRGFGVEGDQHAIATALVGGMFDLVTNWLVGHDSEDPEPLRRDLLRFYRAVRRGL